MTAPLCRWRDRGLHFQKSHLSPVTNRSRGFKGPRKPLCQAHQLGRQHFFPLFTEAADKGEKQREAPLKLETEILIRDSNCMSRDRRTGPADAGKGSPGASKHSAQLWALSRPSPPGSLLWLPQPAQIQNHRHPGMLEAKGSLEITAQVPPTQMAGVLKRKGKSGHRDMKRRRWWEDRTHRVSSCDERGRQGDASTSRGHQRLQRPVEARKEARRFPFRTSRISDFQPPELWGNKLQLCWATLFFFLFLIF